jgi:hypothetical protein
MQVVVAGEHDKVILAEQAVRVAAGQVVATA